MNKEICKLGGTTINVKEIGDTNYFTRFDSIHYDEFYIYFY